MKNLQLILLVFLFSQVSFSQSCLPEGITFTSQAQIDNFQNDYPGCSRIEGDVIIGSPATTNITNLNGLNVLTHIGGSLTFGGNPDLVNLSGLDSLKFIGCDLETYIEDEFAWYWNQALESLTGLESLDTVGRNITIAYNPELDDLTALAGVESFNKFLSIFDNDSLENLIGLEFIDSLDFLQIALNNSLINLSGLDNLSHVGVEIYIAENNSLVSLSGLEKLANIGDDLSVTSNPVLASLGGLNVLNAVGGDLAILSNSALSSLLALDSLVTIGGDFWIENNPALDSLTSLYNLTHIGEGLNIRSNVSLKSLSGLDNVVASNLNYVFIMGNDLLSSCDVQCICDYLSYGSGPFTIEQNATGCDSSDEILELCLTAMEENFSPVNICKVFPNPGVEVINFSISLERSADVKLEIMDSTGKSLYIIINEKLPDGFHNIIFKNKDLQEGFYIYRLTAGGQTETGKLILITEFR